MVEDCEDVSVHGNVVRDVDGPGVVCRGEQSVASDVTVSGNRFAGGVVLSGMVERHLVTDNLTAASSGRS